MLGQPFRRAALRLDVGRDRIGAGGDQHFMSLTSGARRQRQAGDQHGGVDHPPTSRGELVNRIRTAPATKATKLQKNTSPRLKPKQSTALMAWPPGWPRSP